jgi:hypothetical protein
LTILREKYLAPVRIQTLGCPGHSEVTIPTMLSWLQPTMFTNKNKELTMKSTKTRTLYLLT